MLVPREPIRETFELGEGPVTVRIVVGERQQGYSAVSMDETICEGVTVDACEIGDGDALAGKTLYTDTTVTVTSLPPRTAVTIIVEQDGRSKEYPRAREMSGIGDTVIYEGEIKLVGGQA